jgi:hypothetical protein
MKKQSLLIDTDRDWVKDWKGMPEYSQENLDSFSSIIVHFGSKEDRDDFAEVIDQKITSKTKSIWHPKLELRSVKNKRYVDKGDVKK